MLLRLFSASHIALGCNLTNRSLLRTPRTFQSTTSTTTTSTSTPTSAPRIVLRTGLLYPKESDATRPVAEIASLEFARTLPLQIPGQQYTAFADDPQLDLPACEREGCEATDGTKVAVLLTTRGCASRETQWDLFREYPLAVDSVLCTRCQQFFYPLRAPLEALREKVDHALDAMQTGDLLEGEFWLRRAANQFPTALRPRAFLGLMYADRAAAFKAGGDEERKATAAAKEQLEEAVAIFEMLEEQEQGSHMEMISTAYKHLANLHVLDRDLDACIDVLQRYLRLPGLAPEEAQRMTLFMRLNQARQLVNRAKALVVDLIYLPGNPSGALPSTKPAEQCQRDIAEAMELARRARKLDPELPEAMFLLGKCNQRIGASDLAYKYFKLGYDRSDPPDVHFGLELCLTCCQKGFWSQASHVGEQIYALVDSHPEQRAGIFSTFAMALLLDEQLDAAEQVAQQALRVFGDPKTVPMNVANVITAIHRVRTHQLTIDQVRDWARGIRD